jgi:hypothetical protein
MKLSSKCDWFSAQPTILAERAVPRYLAIAPYEVTLPYGISFVTS